MKIKDILSYVKENSFDCLNKDIIYINKSNKNLEKDLFYYIGNLMVGDNGKLNNETNLYIYENSEEFLNNYFIKSKKHSKKYLIFYIYDEEDLIEIKIIENSKKLIDVNNIKNNTNKDNILNKSISNNKFNQIVNIFDKLLIDKNYNDYDYINISFSIEN